MFANLPPQARRTGISATLHRISRSVHATERNGDGSPLVYAVTARVGRTIQGSVRRRRGP